MGIFSDIAGPIANKFEGDIANKRTERHYKKRYQWQVKDMIKAGLNPIVMSSKTGAPGTGVTSPTRMDIKGIGADISNAMQARRQSTELATIKSQKDLNDLLAKKATADAATSAASARNLNAQALLTELGIPAATNAANLQTDFPHIQRAEWLMRNLGPVISGGLAGLLGGKVLRGRGKKDRGHPTDRGPRETYLVPPRDTRGGSRPWRSAAPGASKFDTRNWSK